VTCPAHRILVQPWPGRGETAVFVGAYGATVVVKRLTQRRYRIARWWRGRQVWAREASEFFRARDVAFGHDALSNRELFGHSALAARITQEEERK